jgi:LuxR family transcriptional regulator, maltose regulon positive regulatory protein
MSLHAHEAMARGPGRGQRVAQFARAKFRPPVLPATLVSRPALHGLLAAGASQRLTVVVGSAGAGKSVLLADWAATRSPGTTSWLSGDPADADPLRFWAAFAEAPRAIQPGFGADAADLLAMDGRMSADITASLADDAAKLPAGSVVVVDDFHYASAVARDMIELIERWPAQTAQLVLSGRFDPALRQHRLRMSGELCEIRDRDLYFSVTDSRDLLDNFDVRISDADLALLHQRSEGWAAALQMAALSLRASRDPAQVAQALDVPSETIAAYFTSEVLEQQPPEVARFMLDTSILGTLAADICEAVTGRPGAAAMLRHIDGAHLFLVALDDNRTTFRYHHLVRQVLHAELRARDRARERQLQSRAAEWYESAGEVRRAARHFIAARQADRALGLLQDKVVPDFVADPVMPGPLDLGVINPAELAGAPDRLLAVAADLLLWGDTARADQYLDVLEQTQPTLADDPRLAARFTAIRAFQHAVTGNVHQAVEEALAARVLQQRLPLTDEWNLAVPMLLMDVYNCLEDFPAVEREAAAALEVPTFSEVVRQVVVPGARALAWFEAGRLAEAAAAAQAADAQARRLGFSEHFFAVDHLRVLAGLALERRDLDAAERLIERVLAIIEQRRPLQEFLALLDRSAIWAARGEVRGALTTVAAARAVLDTSPPALLARADESEALIRLAAGDRHSPAELAGRLTAGRRGTLLAKVALAAGDHAAAHDHLQSTADGSLTPREDIVRQALLAAVAIERDDPAAAGIVGGVLQAARNRRFLNTVVTSAPQLASYVIMHAARMQRDPFTERMTDAALEVHAALQPVFQTGHGLAEPLTAAEQRILELLPTSTYLEIAATLYISRNTVKTHLRSIYQKLGVGSRSDAVERAIDLRLL